MLRSLVIRQLFLLVDLVLAAAILFIICQVVMDLMAEDRVVNASGPSTDVGTADYSDRIAKVGPREYYESIIESGIFGDVGRVKVEDVVAPVEDDDTDDEPTATELNLKLHGTTASLADSPYSSAMIENRDNKTRRPYFVGDEIIEGQVTLLKVYRDSVLIDNQAMNRQETLEREKETDDGGAFGRGGRGGRGGKPRPATKSGASNVNRTRITLNKQEFIEELYQDMDDIIAQVKPELSRDSRGNVQGLTSSSIEGIALADQLGLLNNDVIQTINGEKIDSEEKVLEIISKNQKAKAFRIGILRGGKRITKNYYLK